jgi:hypothetical protein
MFDDEFELIGIGTSTDICGKCRPLIEELLSRLIMTLPFDTIDRWQLALFGLCCCERLVPIYQAHFELFGLEPQLDLVPVIWRVANAIGSKTDIDDQQLDLDLAMLRASGITESPSSPYRQTAREALGAVEWLLRFFRECDPLLIEQISKWALAAVEEWAAITSWYAPRRNLTARELHELGKMDPFHAELVWDIPYTNSTAWLEQHPMVVAERNKQAYDFELVRRNPDLSVALIDLMRRSSQAQGVQPRLRGLLPVAARQNLRGRESF